MYEYRILKLNESCINPSELMQQADEIKLEVVKV